MSLPVAGTTIVLYDFWSTGNGLVRHYLAEQVTGPRGDFSFDVRRGVYSIEVVPNRETRFARQSVDTIRVNSNTTLSFSLKNGCELSGSVRTADGAAVADCQLLFYCIEPEALRAAETADDNGHFSISLPRGKYHVLFRHVLKPGSQQAPARSFVCPTLGTIELDRDLRGEDIILPTLVSFTGTVTDSQGHPVPETRVTVRPTHPTDVPVAHEVEMAGVCYTDKAGQFECLVEPGLYDVKLEPGPDSHLSERLVSAILVDQARSRTYSLGSGYRLQGRVSYDGQPVEHALVSVHSGKVESSVLTDKQGRYAFSLSGGTYILLVNSQPDSLARLPYRLLAPYTSSINLAEDTTLDIQLQQGIAISGKVADDAGNPRPAVQLALYSDAGKHPDTIFGAERPLVFGITGDDGSYEFRVSPGDYCVVINNQQSTAHKLAAVESDVQNDLTWHAGCLVQFEMVSDFDEPVPNCRVICQPYHSSGDNAEGVVQTISDERGFCRVAVPAGIYSFRFEPPEHGSFQAKTIRQLSINCDVRRRVKLAPKPVAAH
jgi:hypothetical protein